MAANSRNLTSLEQAQLRVAARFGGGQVAQEAARKASVSKSPHKTKMVSYDRMFEFQPTPARPATAAATPRPTVDGQAAHSVPHHAQPQKLYLTPAQDSQPAAEDWSLKAVQPQRGQHAPAAARTAHTPAASAQQAHADAQAGPKGTEAETRRTKRTSMDFILELRAPPGAEQQQQPAEPAPIWRQLSALGQPADPFAQLADDLEDDEASFQHRYFDSEMRFSGDHDFQVGAAHMQAAPPTHGEQSASHAQRPDPAFHAATGVQVTSRHVVVHKSGYASDGDRWLQENYSSHAVTEHYSDSGSGSVDEEHHEQTAGFQPSHENQPIRSHTPAPGRFAASPPQHTAGHRPGTAQPTNLPDLGRGPAAVQPSGHHADGRHTADRQASPSPSHPAQQGASPAAVGLVRPSTAQASLCSSYTGSPSARAERKARRKSASETEEAFMLYKLKLHKENVPDWRFSQPHAQGHRARINQVAWSFDAAHPALAKVHYLRTKEEDDLLQYAQQVDGQKHVRRSLPLDILDRLAPPKAAQLDKNAQRLAKERAKGERRLRKMQQEAEALRQESRAVHARALQAISASQHVSCSEQVHRGVTSPARRPQTAPGLSRSPLAPAQRSSVSPARTRAPHAEQTQRGRSSVLMWTHKAERVQAVHLHAEYAAEGHRGSLPKDQALLSSLEAQLGQLRRSVQELRLSRGSSPARVAGAADDVVAQVLDLAQQHPPNWTAALEAVDDKIAAIDGQGKSPSQQRSVQSRQHAEPKQQQAQQADRPAYMATRQASPGPVQKRSVARAGDESGSDEEDAASGSGAESTAEEELVIAQATFSEDRFAEYNERLEADMKRRAEAGYDSDLEREAQEKQRAMEAAGQAGTARQAAESEAHKRQRELETQQAVQASWEEQNDWMDQYRDPYAKAAVANIRRPANPLTEEDELVLEDSFVPIVSAELGGMGTRVWAANRRAPKASTYRSTTPEPFTFEERAKSQGKTIMQVKDEQDVLLKAAEEAAEFSARFTANSLPRSTTEPRFALLQASHELKQADIKEQRMQTLQSSERPFSFYATDVAKLEAKRRAGKDPNRFQRRFKAHPIPAAIKETRLSKLEAEHAARQAEAKRRAAAALAAASMPPRMQAAAERPKSAKTAAQAQSEAAKDALKSREVPDFNRLHQQWDRKRAEMRAANRAQLTVPEEFRLGSGTPEQAEARQQQAEQRRQQLLAEMAVEEASMREQRWPYMSSRAKVRPTPPPSFERPQLRVSETRSQALRRAATERARARGEFDLREEAEAKAERERQEDARRRAKEWVRAQQQHGKKAAQETMRAALQSDDAMSRGSISPRSPHQARATQSPRDVDPSNTQNRRDTPKQYIQARHKQAEEKARAIYEDVLLQQGLDAYKYVEGALP